VHACRNLVSVTAPGIVVVGQNVDVGSSKILIQLGRPLVGAAGVAGGDEAEASQPIDVLLALDDENGIIGGVCPQFKQPIEAPGGRP
jgi:hypothetical protein